MPLEIERKFLVIGSPWTNWGAGKLLRQGYLSRSKSAVTRIRIDSEVGYFTIKGKTVGISRVEYEYEIPLEDAQSLLLLCEGHIIEKKRWKVPHGKHVWDFDVFEGVNQGLVIAEIELSDPDELFDKPSWLGEEVSHDPRFFNASLAQKPWSEW